MVAQCVRSGGDTCVLNWAEEIQCPSAPPSPLASYTKEYQKSHCCRGSAGSSLRLSNQKYMGLVECASECDARSTCSHFSHSMQWYWRSGGVCTLCSACDPVGAPSNGRFYDSYRKGTYAPELTPPPSPSPPPESPSPPPTPTSYAQILDSSDCCRENGANLAVEKGSTSPETCHAHCDLEPTCAFFSHSTTYKNCILCSACTPTSGTDIYTSWAKQPLPASAIHSGVALLASTDALDGLHLDDDRLALIFLSNASREFEPFEVASGAELGEVDFGEGLEPEKGPPQASSTEAESSGYHVNVLMLCGAAIGAVVALTVVSVAGVVACKRRQRMGGSDVKMSTVNLGERSTVELREETSWHSAASDGLAKQSPGSVKPKAQYEGRGRDDSLVSTKL